MNRNERPQQPERMLRIAAVEVFTGLKKTTIYKAIKATPPTFPAPVRLGPRAVAWPESSIAAWQAQRQQTRGQ